MSDYESHVGKLIPLNKTVAEFIEDKGIETEIIEFNEGVQGYFNETYDGWRGNEHLVIVNESVYKVEDKEYDPYDCSEASINEDGSISYRVAFYNGGRGFSEALEEAVNKMEKADG